MPKRSSEPRRTAPPPPDGPWTSILPVAAALVVAALAVYGQAASFDFVTLDDLGYVAENPRVLSGLTLSGVVWAFRTTSQANWHPLTWLSLMLDAQFAGPGPRIFHTTSVLLHVANTLLLFGLFHQLTGALWRSGFVAALFAVHPLHVESVAWISERKDVLSTLFWLLTTLAYVRWVRRPTPGRYAIVVLSFAAGLMSKPMLVSLPIVLLLLDYWPLRRFGESRAPSAFAPRRLWLLLRDKVPLGVLALGSCVITLLAQGRSGAVGGADVFPLGVRLANAVNACAGYIVKTLWPAGLAVLYPHPRDTLPAWQVLAAGAGLALATVAAVRLARRRPFVAVGWFWFLVTLVPVIGVVQVGVQAMADRYTYVPLIGLFVIAAWGVPDVVLRLRTWARRSAPADASPAVGRALIAVGTATVVVLAACAFVQAGRWRESVSLFEHTLAVTRNNGAAYDGLGIALARRGDTERAIAAFREALRVDPAQSEVHASLGTVLAQTGRNEDAVAEFRAALRLRPGNAAARANLGTLFLKTGRLDEAEAELTEAVRLDPDNASAQKNLGVILARRGDREGAVRCFAVAVEIDPTDSGARLNLERARSMPSRRPQ